MALTIEMVLIYKLFVGMYNVQLIIRNAFMHKGHTIIPTFCNFRMLRHDLVLQSQAKIRPPKIRIKAQY
jgi:hypothetical protein